VIQRERAERVAVAFPGGESHREAVARVAPFLGEVCGDASCARILLVGHTATRWALDHLLEGRPLEALVTAPFDWRGGWEYAVGRRALVAGAQG
jgi:alpha-ribazole phosphatase/probable phosphoglycerate mutase